MDFFDAEQEHYNNYCQQCTKYKNKLSNETCKWVDTNIDNIKVGDEIYVEYIPSSLKNLYDLTPECGKVVEIQYVDCPYETNNKYTDIVIINHLDLKISIDKGWLGMYSRCYDVAIYKKS